MGPEKCEVEGSTLYTADGEKIGKIWNLAEVTVQAGKEVASAMCPIMADFQGTLTAEPTKSWCCGSRKRFIKLVMSMGYSRTYAVRFAEWARRLGVLYQGVWLMWFFWK